jgi:hypothetical protein
LQRAAEPINRPSHDDIEPAPAGVFPKLIKRWSLIASLGALTHKTNPAGDWMMAQEGARPEVG